MNKGDLFTAIGTPGVAGYNPNDDIVSTLGVYGSTIYALAGGSLYATFNDGALWADRSLPGNPHLGDIYVNPNDPQDVFRRQELLRRRQSLPLHEWRTELERHHRQLA